MTLPPPASIGAALVGLLLASAAAFVVPQPAVADESGGPWSWPLNPRPDVDEGFARPDDPWTAGHRGVDLAGRTGQPVLAIGGGTVSFAGSLAGRGVVVVSHGELRSTYEPVTAAVGVGDEVGAADAIGLLQSVQSHCLPRVCLHLGVIRGQTYLDPLGLLGPREVRLKPLSAGGGASPPALASHQGPAAAAASPPREGPEADSETSVARGAAALTLGALAALGSAVTLTGLARRRYARG